MSSVSLIRILNFNEPFVPLRREMSELVKNERNQLIELRKRKRVFLDTIPEEDSEYERAAKVFIISESLESLDYESL